MKIALQPESNILSCDCCQKLYISHHQCHIISGTGTEITDLCRMQFISVEIKQAQAYTALTILLSRKLNNKLFLQEQQKICSCISESIIYCNSTSEHVTVFHISH